MKLLPDGTYQIQNSSTGETKIVKPEELSNYGLSAPPATSSAAPVAPVTPTTTAPVDPEQAVRSSAPPVPKSLGGLIHNAGQEAVDFAINNPINTTKQIGGVGFEGTRALGMGVTEHSAKSVGDQLTAITQQMKAEKDPLKKQALIAQSRELGNQLENNTEGLNAQTSAADPFINLNSVPKDPGQYLLDTAKNTVADTGKMFGITGDSGSLKFDPNVAIQHAYDHPLSTVLAAKDVYNGVRSLKGEGGNQINPETPETPGSPDTESVPSADETLAAQGKTPKQITREVNNHLVDSQFTIPSKRAAVIKPGEVIKELHADGFGGVKDLDELQNVSDQITGDKGLVTQVTRNAVNSIDGGISMPNDASNPVVQAVRSELKTAYDIPKDMKPDLESEINNMLETTRDPYTPENLDPGKLYEVQRALEKKAVAADAKSTYLSKNLQSEAIADVYRSAADKVRDSIESAAKDQGVVKNTITPEVLAQAQEISPRLAQKLQAAANSGDIASVRTIAKPYARLNEMIGLTKANEFSAFNKMGNKLSGAGAELGGAVAGLPGKIVGSAADAITNGAIGRKIMGAAQNVGDMASSVKDTVGAFRNSAADLKNGVQLPSIPSIPVPPAGTGAAMILNRDLSTSPTDQSGQINTPDGGGMTTGGQVNAVDGGGVSTLAQNDSQNQLPSIQSTPPKTLNPYGANPEQLYAAYREASDAGDKANATQLRQLWEDEKQHQKDQAASDGRNLPARATVPIQLMKDSSTNLDELQNALDGKSADQNTPDMAKYVGTTNFINRVGQGNLNPGAQAAQAYINKINKQVETAIGTVPPDLVISESDSPAVIKNKAKALQSLMASKVTSIQQGYQQVGFDTGTDTAADSQLPDTGNGY